MSYRDNHVSGFLRSLQLSCPLTRVFTVCPYVFIHIEMFVGAMPIHIRVLTKELPKPVSILLKNISPKFNDIRLFLPTLYKNNFQYFYILSCVLTCVLSSSIIHNKLNTQTFFLKITYSYKYFYIPASFVNFPINRWLNRAITRPTPITDRTVPTPMPISRCANISPTLIEIHLPLSVLYRETLSFSITNSLKSKIYFEI